MNKYEKLTEPHKVINNIFENIGAGMEAGTKPLDKLFDDMDNVKDKFFKDIDKALPKEVTYVSRLESEVKQLKDIAKGYRFENDTLKKELKFLRLPLNERLEQEYINKRENEDKQKEKK